eukprot:COSAG01_NODE_1855_length_9052_cov_4.358883_1_plen_111_part_00
MAAALGAAATQPEMMPRHRGGGSGARRTIQVSENGGVIEAPCSPIEAPCSPFTRDCQQSRHPRRLNNAHTRVTQFTQFTRFGQEAHAAETPTATGRSTTARPQPTLAVRT